MIKNNSSIGHLYKKTKMKYLINNIAVIYMMLFTLMGCKQKNEVYVVKKGVPDTAMVFILKKQNIEKQFSFPAELSPIESANIFAKVSGYVRTIKVDIGDHVKKGQLLVQLEAPEIVSNYAQASADVKTAYSRFLGVQDAYSRITKAANVEGTVAAGELEKAKSNMMAAQSDWEAAKSKLNSFEQLKAYLTITAPFNGVVTERNADAGTLIGAGNVKPVLVIENLSILRLRVPVPEAYTATTPDTSAITFTVDAQPNKKYRALLSRKNNTINKEDRTETWEFLYENAAMELKSGMFANASMNLGRSGSSFTVSAAAVATTFEKRFVIRLKNGKTEWVDVRNGFNAGDKIEIFGNLKEGDTLLVKATDEIKTSIILIPKF
jgi:RND family efflux transporter MFP subunit